MDRLIFETHAHYDDARYDGDRDELLGSMRERGVGRIVSVSASIPEFEPIRLLSERYDFIYRSVGVHPDFTGDLKDGDEERIREAAKGPKVVAIGEIGFDRYGESVPDEIQRKWFIEQLRISNELGLPVIVHSRDAAEDTYDVLKEYKTGENAGIVHCFSYSLEMAKRFIDLGYVIGIGGVVTFKNGRVLKEVAANIPDDKFVLETDAPYLAPTPHRGERNDSSLISYVVSEVAALRNISEERVRELAWENSCRVYRMKE